MDDAHVSTWLHCLTSSPDLNDAQSSGEREQLAAWLDLPPSYGGCNLNSLYRSAYEEFLGSFATIAASLIAFYRKTELPIYIAMADALESMGDDGDTSDETVDNPCEVLEDVKSAAERASSALSQTSDEELALASHLIRGHSVVEVPGKWNRLGDLAPDAIVLPESRTLSDFITAPCKHEVGLIKQIRQAKHAFTLYKDMDPVRQTLLRANVGPCGRDTAYCSLKTIRDVATMDCLDALAHKESSYASLFCASTLHRYDFANLDTQALLETCACCNAPLWDPGLHASRADRIFVWQSHLGRCGGDGRRLHAHEAVKLAMKRLVLSCPYPVGCPFPMASILIEPPHLRQDQSGPGDIYAAGSNLHMKDTCMDELCVPTCRLCK